MSFQFHAPQHPTKFPLPDTGTHRKLLLEEGAVIFVEEDLEVPFAPARALLIAVAHLVGGFSNGEVLLEQRVKLDVVWNQQIIL